MGYDISLLSTSVLWWIKKNTKKTTINIINKIHTKREPASIRVRVIITASVGTMVKTMVNIMVRVDIRVRVRVRFGLRLRIELRLRR